MKKILLSTLCLLLLSGCSFMNTPRKATEDLFKKYQTLSEEVVSDLNLTAEGQIFKTSKQREEYMKAMKMQYSDLKYEIIDENVNGDEATITVKISVYDFYKVGKDADNYLMMHSDEFETDGVYDSSKFLTYKIEQMLKASDRVEYTINVDLKKKDDKWKVENFDRVTLEKIHGTYNYENT